MPTTLTSMPNTAPGATHSCYVCRVDLLPDEVTYRSAEGRPDPVPVHLVDAGPGHHELEVHRTHEGARYGTGYSVRSPIAAPDSDTGPAPVLAPDQGRSFRTGPRGVLNPPAPAGVLIDTDVSQWQSRPYDDTYTRRFARYRLTLGMTITDTFGARNTAWCHANAGPGKKLLGHCGYHVWYPGNETGQAARFLAAAVVDPWFVAMVDVESWGGAIRGDHSPQITALVELLAARLGQRRVKVYGNTGDLTNIYPTRPSWLGLVKAGYSSHPPAEPWDGWQYTDGSTTWPVPTGWPRSSAPFGACDHNAFYGTEPEFQAVYGITPPPVVIPPPVVKPDNPATPATHLIPLEESMKTLHRVHDAKFPNTTLPKGTPWPGVFLQGSDLKLHHVETSDDHAAYLQLGIPEKPMTYPEYAAYKRQGLVYA